MSTSSESSDLTSAEKGAVIFRQRCATCHNADPEGEHLNGPNLHGLFGRRIAQAVGYPSYSLASQYKNIVWNEENVFIFLKAPKKFIPGTKMLFEGLEREDQRKVTVACRIDRECVIVCDDHYHFNCSHLTPSDIIQFLKQSSK